MALIDALREWEAQWREAGAPVDRLKAPGSSEAEIREALGWIELHPDIITWFNWQGGVASGTVYFVMPPTAHEPLSLDGVATWRETLNKVVPARAGVEPDPAWLPLLLGENASTILMDQGTGEIIRFQNLNQVDIDETPIRKVSDDLESLVRRWISINERVGPVWSLQYDDGFDYDQSLLTEEEQRLGIVG